MDVPFHGRMLQRRQRTHDQRVRPLKISPNLPLRRVSSSNKGMELDLLRHLLELDLHQEQGLEVDHYARHRPRRHVRLGPPCDARFDEWECDFSWSSACRSGAGPEFTLWDVAFGRISGNYESVSPFPHTNELH